VNDGPTLHRRLLDQKRLEALRERRRVLAELQLEQGSRLAADEALDYRTLSDTDINCIVRAVVHGAGHDTFAMSPQEIDQTAWELLTESINEDLERPRT
jgi:hypothetical protein